MTVRLDEASGLIPQQFMPVYGYLQSVPHSAAPGIVAWPLVDQMSMGVDEAGAERGIAEVDHRRTVRDRQPLADGQDLLALDDHHAALDQDVRLAVEQPGCLEHDGLRLRRRGWLVRAGLEEQEQGNEARGGHRGVAPR